MEFTPQEIWAHTGAPVRVVLAIMALMAVWCMYIAIERTIHLARATSQSRALAAAITQAMKAGDADAALVITKKEDFKLAYLAAMLRGGLQEFSGRPDKHGIEAAERALERAAVKEGEDLRKGMAILATTGSTAPFVGLVGTIFGIINAFQGMAATGSGGLGAVSAGIAEALITTAIGISVAILGVWLFNYFNGRVDRIVNDMTVSVQEFLDWCEKQILPPFENAAK